MPSILRGLRHAFDAYPHFSVASVSGVLVVRPSSLGDVVYALALVSDVARHRPGLAVDWVAEDSFVDLVRLDPRIRRVVPLSLRRWRHAPLATATWRDMAAFRRAMREERYDAILNLQEQVKGAVVSWFAHGTRHGLDRDNIREPIATLVDHVHHPVSRNLHLVDRCRGVAAAALGYTADGPPRWNFVPPLSAAARPAVPYALAFHATSRADKQWPEAQWCALATHLARAGFVTLLPWGNAEEEARSRRIANGAEGVVVPPRQSLPELATLARHAEIVVGVDTGLTHLAAALGTSTVSIFTTTDPRLAGVARAGPHARDAGGNGAVPSLADIVDLCGQLMRQAPRC
ncbi:MAG: lipopolysaccharide heptosyltransferase I [Betaproteobacteria bacterium]